MANKIDQVKVSVFVATSLDGFIARKDGSIEWLNRANSVVPPGEDCGFQTFMDSVDVLVMGRNTFDQVLTFGAWPYGSKKVIVMTSRSLTVPDTLTKTVSKSSEAPQDLVKRLSSEGIKHIYVDGGLTVQRFLQEDLLDEATITLIPVLLGEGKSLFGSSEKEVTLTHLSTQSYQFGFVQLKYRLEKKSKSAL